MRLLSLMARLWTSAVSYVRSLGEQAQGKGWEPIPRIAGTGVRSLRGQPVRSLRRMMRRNAETFDPRMKSGRQWKRRYKVVQRLTGQRFVDMPQYITAKSRVPALARFAFAFVVVGLFIALALS